MTIPCDEAIRRRRSIRRYEPREVPEALVREVLDLARHAPSSMDGQPWCFVVIRSTEAKQRLATIKNAHRPADRAAYPADFLAAAPVIVAVCVEKGLSNGRELENGILATASLLLAAQVRGLGGVFLTAYQPDVATLALEIRRLLGLPPEIEPVTLVPLGFPAETPARKDMRNLEEMIHHEVFAAEVRA